MENCCYGLTINCQTVKCLFCFWVNSSILKFCSWSTYGLHFPEVAALRSAMAILCCWRNWAIPMWRCSWSMGWDLARWTCYHLSQRLLSKISSMKWDPDGSSEKKRVTCHGSHFVESPKGWEIEKESVHLGNICVVSGFCGRFWIVELVIGEVIW